MLRNPASNLKNPDFKVTVGDVVAAMKRYDEKKGMGRKFGFLGSAWDHADINKLSNINLSIADQPENKSLDESQAFELMDILLHRTTEQGHLSDQVLMTLDTKLAEFMTLFRVLGRHKALANLSFTPIYEQAKHAGDIKYYIEQLAELGVPIEVYAKMICTHWKHHVDVFALVAKVIQEDINPKENLNKIFQFAEHADRILVYLNQIITDKLTVKHAFPAVLNHFEALSRIEKLLQESQVDVKRFQSWVLQKMPKFEVIGHVDAIVQQLKVLGVPLTEDRIYLICTAADNAVVTTIRAVSAVLQAFSFLSPDSAHCTPDFFDDALLHPSEVAERIKQFQAEWATVTVERHYKAASPKAVVLPQEEASRVQAGTPPKTLISIFSPPPSPARVEITLAPSPSGTPQPAVAGSRVGGKA
jgi:hypothetical protein